MAYGTLAVDYITYTFNSADSTATVSSVVNGSFPAVTSTGTISGNAFTGAIANFTNLTGISGTFTNQISGAVITGNTGQFTTLTGNSGTFATGVITVIGAGQTTPITTVDVSGAYASNVNAVSALTIDCSSGNYFTKTVTSGSTFAVTGVPSNRAYSFTLEVVHTVGAIVWFSGVEWPNGTAPTLTSGKTHLFMFVTDDGGARWRASSLINYTT